MAKRKFTKSAQAKTSITVEIAFNQFIEEKEAMNLSPATVVNYQYSFEVFYDYHELTPESLLEDIDIQMFYQWINEMWANDVRPQSINHYLRDWRTFLNWCYERKYIKEKIGLKEVEVQEDLPKMYSDEDIMELLVKPGKNAGFTDWRSWAIVSTVYATGLRARTIVSLTIGDIDFQREELTIKRQKNKQVGVLPLTPALSVVLKEYLKKWMADEPPTAYLFPSITGDQITVNGLNHATRRYCKSRGVEHHGLHAIRHNFARDMILNGAGEYRLQRYLQHSTIQMSQHYVKLYNADLKKDAPDFSPLDNVKKKTLSKFKKS